MNWEGINNDGRVLLTAANSTLPGRDHPGLPALQTAHMNLFAEWQKAGSDQRRARDLELAMMATRALIERFAGNSR